MHLQVFFQCYSHVVATAPVSLYYTVFSFCCNINKVYLKIFYVEAIMMSLTRSRFGTASPGILAICTHQSMTVKYCLYSDTLDAQLGEHIRHFLKCQIAHHSHFSPGLSLFIFLASEHLVLVTEKIFFIIVFTNEIKDSLHLPELLTDD